MAPDKCVVVREKREWQHDEGEEERRGMCRGKVSSHEQAESALMMCPLCSFPRAGRKEQLFVPAIPACLPELHSHIIFT